MANYPEDVENALNVLSKHLCMFQIWSPYEVKEILQEHYQFLPLNDTDEEKLVNAVVLSGAFENIFNEQEDDRDQFVIDLLKTNAEKLHISLVNEDEEDKFW